MLPVETVLRIWDTVFFEGSKILFRVAIGLLKLNKERLLAQKDFAALIEEFKYIVDSSQVRFYIRWKKEKAQVKLLFCTYCLLQSKYRIPYLFLTLLVHLCYFFLN